MRSKQRWLFVHNYDGNLTYIVTTKIRGPGENAKDQAYNIVANDLGVIHFQIRKHYRVIPMSLVTSLNAEGKRINA